MSKLISWVIIFTFIWGNSAKSGEYADKLAPSSQAADAARSATDQTTKAVYFFGIDRDGHDLTEGSSEMVDLLGGKGAGLAQMAKLTYEVDGKKHPIMVPPGFTVTTEEARKYFENKSQLKQEVIDEILSNLRKLEEITGRNFGGTSRPLLVSVRSGARVSMPGMMDTILNLGLNDETVQILAEELNNPKFAWDSYRRLIMMFGDVVLGINKKGFDRIFENKKKEKGVTKDTDLNAEDLKDVVTKFKAHIQSQGKEFPQDVREQLFMAISAVFDSSNNERAITYRRINKLPADTLSAANVQSMVFGNLNDNSATGVAFTRDPSTGENVFYGEYLLNAQGEDVVAGVRTPMPINKDGKEKFLRQHPEYKDRESEIVTLEEAMPEAYKQLVAIYQVLEKFYKDMQDIEFTIQDGELYLLQTRNGKRTAMAALNILMDLYEDDWIDEEEAVMRLGPDQIDQFLHPVFDPKEKAKAKIIAKGLPASPGAAIGEVVFNSKEAEELAKEGRAAILIRDETSAEDISGMKAAKGILTVRGGMTSHAAVVARGMGKTAVVGAGKIDINEEEGYFKVGDTTVRKGDVISIDGYTGEVMLEEVKTADSIVIKGKSRKTLNKEEQRLYERFTKFFEWVDKYRGGIRANAETARDAIAAFKYFGADGIGLARSEHMFFHDILKGENRILKFRKMILRDELDQAVLAQLGDYQKGDYRNILKIADGKPITIRLLDPPLHEFLPDPEKKEGKKAITELAQELSMSEDDIVKKINKKKEENPMAGFRGDRLGMKYPEITKMQVRAIFNAYKETRDEYRAVAPIEIMIPLIGVVEEFNFFAEMIEQIARDEFGFERHENYLIGTMIEVPSAAIMAEEIARKADFFSFGTNDLTQFSFKFSRDDAGNVVIPAYIEKGILKVDPFVTIDEVVGELIRIATTVGKEANPRLKVGICGEQGGDPESISETIVPAGLDYASCSPFRVPGAKLASAQKRIRDKRKGVESVEPYDLDRLKTTPAEVETVTVNRTEELVLSNLKKMLREELLEESPRVAVSAWDSSSDYETLLRADNNAFIKLFDKELASLFDGTKHERKFHELNPALGNRGVRQALTGFDAIFRLQLIAICIAVEDWESERNKMRVVEKDKTSSWRPRVIVPLLIDPQEFKIIRDMLNEILDSKKLPRDSVQLGACIETPRAALLAGEFANMADFIIFDTMGLTESVLAITQKDAGSFLPMFVQKGIYRANPLEVISRRNVGKFIDLAVKRIREVNQTIAIYSFGHRMEPVDIESAAAI